MKFSMNIKPMNRKGVTLVELVLAMAILSIVMGTIYSINLFGLRTFAQSNLRAENQYETRMPADFIAKRIRYANSIEILSDVPEDTPSNAHEIFIDSGELKYREGGSEAVLIGTQGVTDYSLEMSRKSGTSNVIQYTIGKAGTDKYDLVTDVVILNLESKGITGPDQGIGVRFYTDAAENVTPVSIVSLVNPPAQYTSVDAPVALPFRVTANMSDGTTRKVSVRWTPSLIDTSIPGVYTSTGRVVGHSGTVSLTVTVGAYDIIGIDDVNITVSQGQDFSMPETVVATIKVGEHIFTQNVSVVWDDVIDSATIGEFQTNGTVEGWENPVLLTVTVEEATIVSVNNIYLTVLQGTSFSLPSTVPAVFSNGIIQDIPVTWTPATLSTSSPGAFYSTGSIAGYGAITFELTVEPNKLPKPTSAEIKKQSNPGGQQGRVFVSGTAGAQAVFRRSDGSVILTHVIPSGGEGEFSVDTRYLYDVILRKDGWQDSDPYIF